MKICVSSSDTILDARVDPRFGRCAYFLFVDPDTLEFDVVANPNAQLPPGAAIPAALAPDIAWNDSARASGHVGILSARFVAKRGVEAVLAGSVGRNAERVLRSAGIEIMTGFGGTVREAVQAFKSHGKRTVGTKPSPCWAERREGASPGGPG